MIRQPTVRVVRVLSRSRRACCIARLDGGLEIEGINITLRFLQGRWTADTVCEERVQGHS